jgi:hypothetical protein
MWEVAEGFSLLKEPEEIASADMDGMPHGDHLQLGRDQP